MTELQSRLEQLANSAPINSGRIDGDRIHRLLAARRRRQIVLSAAAAVSCILVLGASIGVAVIQGSEPQTATSPLEETSPLPGQDSPPEKGLELDACPEPDRKQGWCPVDERGLKLWTNFLSGLSIDVTAIRLVGPLEASVAQGPGIAYAFQGHIENDGSAVGRIDMMVHLPLKTTHQEPSVRCLATANHGGNTTETCGFDNAIALIAEQADGTSAELRLYQLTEEFLSLDLQKEFRAAAERFAQRT